MAINEASHEVREFTIDIPDEKLEDMYERLRRTRFPLDFANDDWRYGYNTAYHRELVDYWIHEGNEAVPTLCRGIARSGR